MQVSRSPVETKICSLQELKPYRENSNANKFILKLQMRPGAVRLCW